MDVAAWLEELGLAQYAEAFAENNIDREVMPHLTERDLEDLGLTVGHRRKLLLAIGTLAAEASAAATTKAQSDPVLEAAERPAVAAERRQLTLMFCDLVGSTAMSGRLDPEDMGAVIRSYQVCCSDVVKRWEGHVARYMGDGVLVYFGYPRAHEDDAERAVRAAVEITDAVRGLVARDDEPLAVRIGIATGLVLVGDLVGEGAMQDEDVVGETPNLAARLQGIAEPNTVVVSSSTHRLVRGLFEFEDLGSRELKGIAGPVTVWRVVGERRIESRFEAAQLADLTPFVGREAEFAMLTQRWEQAKDGEGQVVLLCGEPGIGKSRMTQVLRERIAEEDCVRLRYQCTPHHTNSALYPIIKHIERAAGFVREESDDTKLEKVEALIARARGDVSAVAPLYARMLSIEPGDRYAPLEASPQKQKQLTLHALVEHAVALSGEQPVLMIFEDVHWVDPTSQELLDLLVPRVADHRVLLLMTHRPEYQFHHSELAHVMPLMLTHLDRKQAAAMVHEVTGGKSLPDEVLDQIVARTDGIPLFVEELTKTVLESGLLEEHEEVYTLAGPLPDLAIPSTLRDSLMARLDHLAAAKEVAQIGACIGREFSYELIAAVSSPRVDQLNGLLAQLIDSGLVLRMGSPPDVRYQFRHALVQNVAYESLLKSKRRSLHSEIGKVLESEIASTAELELDVIAQQFSKGGVWLKAAEYYRRAAQNAARAFAVREALALYDEALVAGGHLDAGDAAEILMSIYQAKSELYFAIGDFEQSCAENARMLEISRRVENRDRESTALAGMAWAAMWAEDFDSALASAREAIDVAEAADCRSALGSAHMTTGCIHAVSGEVDRAVDDLGKALTICRSAGDVLRESLTLYMSGNIENWRGAFDKAVDLASAGALVAREHNLIAAFLRCRYAEAISLAGRGDYDHALTLLNEGLALAEKIGDEAFIPRYWNGLGWLYIECEDVERGLDFSHRGAELSRQRRHATGVEMTCFAEVNIGDVFLAKGDLTLAHEMLEGVHRISQNPATCEWMKWRYSTHLFASLGRLWLYRGNPGKAREFADQCLKIAVPMKSRKYMVSAWLLLGEVALAQRDWDEAERWLRQALRLARAIGHLPQLWRAHLALGRLYAETKRVDSGQQEYRVALSIVERIKGHTKDLSLRDGLKGSPRQRQVYELAEVAGR